jgi:hypothetical protein
VTLTGKATLKGLPVGAHRLVVYATDAVRNTATKIVQFSVTQETKQPEPESSLSVSFPTTIAIGSVIAAVAVVGVGLLVYLKKHRGSLVKKI